MTTLAERVREARVKSGISQRELARLAKLSEGYPGHIESGKVEAIGSDIAERLARVLGCSLDWLITGGGRGPSKRQVLEAVAAARDSLTSEADAPSAANGDAA